MKRSFLNEMREIQRLADKVNKMDIKESIVFEDEDLDTDTDNEEWEENKDKKVETMNMEEDSTIDVIREITLKGMIKLCKTPENPEFQTLLKIFQICNKGSEPKEDKL